MGKHIRINNMKLIKVVFVLVFSTLYYWVSAQPTIDINNNGLIVVLSIGPDEYEPPVINFKIVPIVFTDGRTLDWRTLCECEYKENRTNDIWVHEFGTKSKFGNSFDNLIENPILEKKIKFIINSCYQDQLEEDFEEKLQNSIQAINKQQLSNYRYKFLTPEYFNFDLSEVSELSNNWEPDLLKIFLLDEIEANHYASPVGSDKIVGNASLLLPSILNHELEHLKNHGDDNSCEINCVQDQLCFLNERYAGVSPLSLFSTAFNTISEPMVGPGSDSLRENDQLNFYLPAIENDILDHFQVTLCNILSEHDLISTNYNNAIELIFEAYLEFNDHRPFDFESELTIEEIYLVFETILILNSYANANICSETLLSDEVVEDIENLIMENGQIVSTQTPEDISKSFLFQLESLKSKNIRYESFTNPTWKTDEITILNRAKNKVALNKNSLLKKQVSLEDGDYYFVEFISKTPNSKNIKWNIFNESNKPIFKKDLNYEKKYGFHVSPIMKANQAKQILQIKVTEGGEKDFLLISDFKVTRLNLKKKISPILGLYYNMLELEYKLLEKWVSASNRNAKFYEREKYIKDRMKIITKSISQNMESLLAAYYLKSRKKRDRKNIHLRKVLENLNHK